MDKNLFMMALMLVVIAMGAVVFERQPIMGIIQIVLGAISFSYRLNKFIRK